MRSFDANTSDGLPEHFDDLPIIGMQFIPEILTRIHFWLFQRKGCEHARLTANVVKMYLCLGYFLRSNSICHHLVFYCVVTFLPVLDSPSRFRMHAYPSSRRNYSCLEQLPLHLRTSWLLVTKWELWNASCLFKSVFFRSLPMVMNLS